MRDFICIFEKDHFSDVATKKIIEECNKIKEEITYKVVTEAIRKNNTEL